MQKKILSVVVLLVIVVGVVLLAWFISKQTGVSVKLVREPKEVENVEAFKPAEPAWRERTLNQNEVMSIPDQELGTYLAIDYVNLSKTKGGYVLFYLERANLETPIATTNYLEPKEYKNPLQTYTYEQNLKVLDLAKTEIGRAYFFEDDGDKAFTSKDKLTGPYVEFYLATP